MGKLEEDEEEVRRQLRQPGNAHLRHTVLPEDHVCMLAASLPGRAFLRNNPLERSVRRSRKHVLEDRDEGQDESDTCVVHRVS